MRATDFIFLAVGLLLAGLVVFTVGFIAAVIADSAGRERAAGHLERIALYGLGFGTYPGGLFILPAGIVLALAWGAIYG